ncbi:MAG: Y-family DNA polymerase [Pirellulaceae bacterium]
MNHPSTTHDEPKQVLCVWLPNWPIQRLVAAASELRRTQVILYRNQPARGQIVTAVSPAAEQGGARVGMPLSEAKSLAGRNQRYSDYHIFEHNPAADLRSLEQLAMECQQFSPVVGLESCEEDGKGKGKGKGRGKKKPSSLLLDITGLTHLFGGEEGLRGKVHEFFQTRGLLVATAIAATISRAWGLAHFADEDDFDALPIEALRLHDVTIDTLQQLGVRHIWQLRQLPRTGLRSRFGNELTRRLDQADGCLEEVIVAIYPPPDYVAEKFLDYPLTDRETIQVLMSQLAADLCRQMRATGRGGLVWQFRLSGPCDPGQTRNQQDLEPPQPPFEKGGSQYSPSFEKGGSQYSPPFEKGGNGQQPIELTVKLFQPIATLDHLMPLVEMQMEQMFSFSGGRHQHQKKNKINKRQQLQFAVQEVSVTVRNCVLLSERQRQLFDENPRLDRQALAHLINRLSSRLGAENVLRPRLHSGAQAEDACWLEPLVGQSRQHAPRRRIDTQAISPLQRPLILHARPQEIEAVALDGKTWQSSAAPAMFLHGQQRLRVVRRWGPERIETAWWRGPTVRRDYWRIETSDRRWLWVYRNLQDRRWFLQGEF